MDEITISAPRLTAAIESIVAKGGSNPREASLVATNLVEANLTGHDSHGVGMIPRYVDALLEGGLSLNQAPTVMLDSGPLLRLDGNAGYGQVIGVDAMSAGIARAKAHGVCVVALANSHHLGRIGHWAELCVREGLVSLHFVNVISRPIVAPWNGRDARFGTNPVCIGIPRPGRDPILLDFATSRIAQGKTRVAHNQGKRLPEGILIDDKGEPTTDPRYGVVQPLGAILPFGEHKGYGLALVCELLGGALTGGQTQHVRETTKRRVLNGMLTVIIDPTKLGTGAVLAAETDAFVAWLLESPPAGEAVKLSGDPEREKKRARLAAGIPVDHTSWLEILTAAEKLGMERRAVEATAGVGRG